MEAERETMSKGDRSMVATAESPPSQVEDSVIPGSKKRAASPSLEHGPVKALKSVAGGEGIRERNGGTMGTGGENTGAKEDVEESYKVRFEQLKDKANTAFKKLKAEKKDLEEERDEIRGEKTMLEVEREELREKLKSAKGVDNAKQIAKRVEEDIKKKYDKKTNEMQVKHETTLEQRLASKQKNYQKKLDDYKEKKETAEQEAKDAKADFTQKEKKLTREYAEFKKDLREEQQQEIKRQKVEDNSELKEKKDLLKTYEMKIKVFQKQIAQHGEEVGVLQARIQKLEMFKTKAHERIRHQEDALRKEKDFALSIGQEYAAKMAELQGKLEAEGKRWEKMRECCEDARQKLVAQQRSNFVLREANEGLVRRCQQLRAGSGGWASGRVGQKERSVGVAVGTQTEAETEIEGRAAVGGMAEKGGGSDGEYASTSSATEAANDGMESQHEISHGAQSQTKANTALSRDDGNAREDAEGPEGSMRSNGKNGSPLDTTVSEQEKVDTPMNQPIFLNYDDAPPESTAVNDSMKDVQIGMRDELDASANAAGTKTNSGGANGSWVGDDAPGQVGGWESEGLESGLQAADARASDRDVDMDVDMEGEME